MNKIGKTVMYTMSVMGASMMGYYIGMPKAKKEDIKNKMKNMVSMNGSENNM